MELKRNKVSRLCPDCNGYGAVSSCCNSGTDDNRCDCGRFCRQDFCHKCGSECELVYRVGDQIELMVWGGSPKWIKETLYNPKGYFDTKFYYGKIVEIIDDNYVSVKLRKRPEIVVMLEDIDHLD